MTGRGVSDRDAEQAQLARLCLVGVLQCTQSLRIRRWATTPMMLPAHDVGQDADVEQARDSADGRMVCSVE